MTNSKAIVRNLDILNGRLRKFTVPTHRQFISDSFSNLDWLRKNLHKRNTVDAETARLLLLSSFDLNKSHDE